MNDEHWEGDVLKRWATFITMADRRKRVKIHYQQDVCISELAGALKQLRWWVAQTVPFLEEAWHACFHGQPTALLSAEERGMGSLLAQFREIAAGGAVMPPGVITTRQAMQDTARATKWATDRLGNPNELPPELARWMTVGQTCLDGLKKASAEVDRLQFALDMEKNSIMERLLTDKDAIAMLHAAGWVRKE